MRWVFFSGLTIALISSVESIRVLLLGDSVDRWIVHDWCYLQRGRGNDGKNYEWSAGSIHYMNKHGELPAQVCTTENSSIAFAHLYGSSPTGPYFHGFNNSESDPYIDTPARIQKILELYKANVGPPDRIMFTTNQWDVQGWYFKEHFLVENETMWNTAVAQFTINLRDRVDEIIKAVGKDVDVGLRTAVWEAKGGALLKTFNNIQRKFAEERGLTLMDMDEDVWSSVGHDYSASNEDFLFRDWIHPKPYYMIAAAHKILGEQYTSSITTRHTKANYGHDFFLDFFTTTKVVYIIRANLKDVEGGKQLFFFRRSDAKLYRNPNEHFMRAIRVGPADILDISDGESLRGISVGSMPPIFQEFSIYNASAGKIFFAHGGTRRLLSARSIDGVRAIYKFTSPVIHVEEGSDAETWMRYIDQGPDMPDFYVEGAVMKIQGHREIFCFTNGTRRSIPSMQVFAALGKDLSNVISIPLTVLKDLEAVPMGPSY